jgi:hypothetical protein
MQASVDVTATGGGHTSTTMNTDLTETADDFYKGRILNFYLGNLAGQSTDITDYNGTTKTLTFTALAGYTPQDSDKAIIT